MKFLCDIDKLNEALSIVTRALPPRGFDDGDNKYHYDGLFIVSDDQRIRFACTDTMLGLEVYLDAEILEEGAIVLPGKLFSDLVRKFPSGGTLSFQMTDSTSVVLKCLGSTSRIVGFSPDSFPQTPEVEKAKAITVPRNIFKNLIERTTFAVATDGTRPILEGCYLECEGNSISLVALDGFRLALRKYECDHELGSLTAVIPGKILNEISRLIESSEDDITLQLSVSYLLIQNEKERIVARLLEGEYISYRQILPKDWQTKVIVSREALGNAMERVSVIAHESMSFLARFHIEERQMIVTSTSENCNITEVIPIESEGKDLDIAFNVKYITDNLRMIEDETVSIYFNTNVSPCVFKPLDGDQYLYLTLPVRVSVS